MVVEDSSGYFLNCVISHNTGTLRGGGMYVLEDASYASFTNCIVSGNTAPEGGGIYCWQSSGPQYGNCLITDNTVTRGGGVFCGLPGVSKALSVVVAYPIIVLGSTPPASGCGAVGEMPRQDESYNQKVCKRKRR